MLMKDGGLVSPEMGRTEMGTDLIWAFSPSHDNLLAMPRTACIVISNYPGFIFTADDDRVHFVARCT